jgi:hypothetical protein
MITGEDVVGCGISIDRSCKTIAYALNFRSNYKLLYVSSGVYLLNRSEIIENEYVNITGTWNKKEIETKIDVCNNGDGDDNNDNSNKNLKLSSFFMLSYGTLSFFHVHIIIFKNSNNKGKSSFISIVNNSICIIEGCLFTPSSFGFFFSYQISLRLFYVDGMNGVATLFISQTVIKNIRFRKEGEDNLCVVVNVNHGVVCMYDCNIINITTSVGKASVIDSVNSDLFIFCCSFERCVGVYGGVLSYVVMETNKIPAMVFLSMENMFRKCKAIGNNNNNNNGGGGGEGGERGGGVLYLEKRNADVIILFTDCKFFDNENKKSKNDNFMGGRDIYEEGLQNSLRSFIFI